MKQDKWTQQLHDKLAGHEVAPPDDLWADIEAALPAPRKSRFVALQRWAAAAAVAALMIGGGYMLWESSSNSPRRGMSEEASITSSDRTQDTAEQVAKILQAPTPPLEGMGKATDRQPKVGNETAQEGNRPASSEPETTSSEPETTSSEPETTSSEPDTTSNVIEAEQAIVRELERQTAMSAGTTTKQPLTLGLYATNGLNSQSSSNGVLMAEEMANQFRKVYENSYATATRSSEPIYLTGYEERQHHHRPITYGLTLSYPLTERLSLTSGVVYTKLTSDFTQVIRNTQIQREQTLHYIGIPVSVNYQLWAQRGFRAYVSAGALAYWNVKTRLKTEGVTQKLDKDRMQWSLSGSVGVQYDIIPQLGLYAEPGLSYYPDNGSRLQNFFKEKPLNLSLQLGLRLNFTR